MKRYGLWVLLPLCMASTNSEDSPCVHPGSGESRAISLDQAAKAQETLRNRLAMSWEKSLKLTTDAAFDSGLPACKGRETRRLSSRLPSDLVGRSIAFGPAERIPQSDVRVATSARRISDLRADALADPKLIQRLGVRCAPTVVCVISEVEVELLENP